MIDKFFKYHNNNQILNNEYDLKILNVQLDFYEKLLKNAKTKEEKNKYQAKIDNINQNIDNKLNDINILYNLD